MLKIGTMVRVYQKHLSGEDFEGFARIHSVVSDDAESPIYNVQFSTACTGHVHDTREQAILARAGTFERSTFRRIVLDNHAVSDGTNHIQVQSD